MASECSGDGPEFGIHASQSESSMCSWVTLQGDKVQTDKQRDFLTTGKPGLLTPSPFPGPGGTPVPTFRGVVGVRISRFCLRPSGVWGVVTGPPEVTPGTPDSPAVMIFSGHATCLVSQLTQ